MKVYSVAVNYVLKRCSHKSALNAPPQPKGLPLIGTMLDLMAAGGGTRLHLYIDKRHTQLGPIFTEKLGPVKATFIADPRYMRQVFAAEGKYPVHLVPEAWLLYNKLFGSERGLFFMNGEEWLKYRHIMNKIMFKNEPSKGVVNAFKNCTADLVNDWKYNIDKPVNNLEYQMYRLSISYVIAALVGSSYPSIKDQLRPTVDYLSSNIHLIFKESTKLNLIPAKIAASLRLPVWQRFVSAVNSSLTTGKNLVIQLLSEASSDGILLQMSAEGISEEKITSIAIDLILAASDTTPNSMIWALYLLSHNPSVQSQVAHEPSLLKAVMRETLRLYPAAPFITRVLPSDITLGSFTVPAGELVILSLYTSGRSEQYFPDAHKFLPERWLRDDKSYRGVTDATASLPFAMGARSCIGKKLTEAEMNHFLGQILTNFRVEVKKEVEMILKLVPVPAEPVILYLSERSR